MDGCAAITRQGTSSDNEPCAVPAELDVGVTEEAEVELQMDPDGKKPPPPATSASQDSRKSLRRCAVVGVPLLLVLLCLCLAGGFLLKPVFNGTPTNSSGAAADVLRLPDDGADLEAERLYLEGLDQAIEEDQRLYSYLVDIDEPDPGLVIPITDEFPTGPTEALILGSSADAEVREDQPGKNYGTKKSMSVNGRGSAKIALISFDVNLPEGTMVKSAKLHLFAQDSTADLHVATVFGGNFDESSITWDTLDPSIKAGQYHAEAMLPGSDTAGERTVDIAPFRPSFQPKNLQESWLIVISDPLASDFKQKFHTREAKNSTFHPRLEITYYAKLPGIVVSPSGASVVDELGGQVDLSITLSRSPTHPVIIPITVSNTLELQLLSASSLQFDSSNWNIPQTVRVQGVDDGVADGPQDEALVFLPMISDDPMFGGVKPPSHPITNHVIQIVTKPWQRTAYSGMAFAMTIQAVSSEAGKPNFYIPPHLEAGLHVNKRTGAVTWQPDRHQAGRHQIPVEVTLWNNTDISPRIWTLNMVVFERQANPPGLYVWPEGGNDNGNDGTSSSPWASVAHAARLALPGDTIYIRGGRHHISENDPDKMPTTIVAQGAPNNHIVITRLPGERVAITCVNQGFYIPPGSQGITIRGLEMDGETDVNDHWQILATSWWTGPNWEKHIYGCRKGIQVDGSHVVVEDNVIHDFRQKGVNVFEGRYVTVRHNVVYNIAHHSISGGHGIMRQWERNFGDHDPDDPGYYRWDFYGNLLFAVEQRIYSNRLRHRHWVYLRLDEGKSILWDRTEDTYMKARCAQNLILYAGLDGIRMKGNPNVTVHNNAVLTVKERVRLTPDGITADNDDPLPNLVLKDNLVHSYFHDATNKGHAFGTWDNFDDEDFPNRIEKNYCSGGGIVYKGPVKGIANLGEGASVFVNHNAKDFRANPQLPAGVGVPSDVLDRMFAMANDYGVTVEESGWRHDHIRSVETILANAPGSQVNLTHSYWIAPSVAKRKLGVDAYWFKVMPGSDLEKGCHYCSQVEVIPDVEYWADVAAQRSS